MKKLPRLALILALGLMIAGLAIWHSPAITALAATWNISCTGVASSERGFWKDIAGPATNDEGGLFWFINNSTGDEKCSAWAEVNPTVSTTTYPKLRVRAAINDSARFNIKVYEFGVSEFCETLVNTVSWSDTEDHSGFLTKEITLASGKNICRVEINLDDYPNSTNTGITNVLIADIRIWNGTSNGWRESFAANP